ncbi:FkbM family methyltransferase [Calothrix sp. PCC 7507]|uniref:FkbM family methyltransferase n=1 Tax=Calothrix sp. PCC 7507 TaxID=99598 RepID=UPI00029F2819|nr:FkbM family methyltransferase [Calothrix sp. PCC 7507]AFY35292.1 methyltransferase FkbM family [Calothrix sp. PCC 7507]
MQDYFKHLLIRTPLQKPAETLRSLVQIREQKKYPELQEIYLEPYRIEQMMRRVINHSFNCFDIGCHLGALLNTMLQLAPQGKHIAFEPTPHKANWLRQKFPEVDIRELALSDKPGEVAFYINTRVSGVNALYAEKKEESENTEKIIVKSERLDNVLNPEQRVDFIKIDVIGAELAVLRGAEETLSRYQPIVLFESGREKLATFNFTTAEVFEFLTQQHSYSIFLLKDFLNNGQPLSFERFDQAHEYPFQAFNFLAVPKQG